MLLQTDRFNASRWCDIIYSRWLWCRHTQTHATHAQTTKERNMHSLLIQWNKGRTHSCVGFNYKQANGHGQSGRRNIQYARTHTRTQTGRQTDPKRKEVAGGKSERDNYVEFFMRWFVANCSAIFNSLFRRSTGPIYLFVCIANHISICARTNYIIQSDWLNHSYTVHRTDVHIASHVLPEWWFSGLVSWEFGPWLNWHVWGTDNDSNEFDCNCARSTNQISIHNRIIAVDYLHNYVWFLLCHFSTVHRVLPAIPSIRFGPFRPHRYLISLFSLMENVVLRTTGTRTSNVEWSTCVGCVCEQIILPTTNNVFIRLEYNICECVRSIVDCYEMNAWVRRDPEVTLTVWYWASSPPTLHRCHHFLPNHFIISMRIKM